MARTKQTCGRSLRHMVEQKEDADNDALGADSIIETLCHYALDDIPDEEEKAAVFADLVCIFRRGLSPLLQHQIQARVQRNISLGRVCAVFHAFLRDPSGSLANMLLYPHVHSNPMLDSDADSDVDSVASGAGRRGTPPGE